MSGSVLNSAYICDFRKALLLMIICVQAWLYTILIPLRFLLLDSLAYILTAIALGFVIGRVVRRSNRALDFALTVWLIHVGGMRNLYLLGTPIHSFALFLVCCTLTWLISREICRSEELRDIIIIDEASLGGGSIGGGSIGGGSVLDKV